MKYEHLLTVEEKNRWLDLKVTLGTVDGLIRRLGKDIYDHPDLVRVIEQDYPQLLQRVTRLEEVRLQQEREETDKGTRTSR